MYIHIYIYSGVPLTGFLETGLFRATSRKASPGSERPGLALPKKALVTAAARWEPARLPSRGSLEALARRGVEFDCDNRMLYDHVLYDSITCCMILWYV